jgi:hypothetical protein
VIDFAALVGEQVRERVLRLTAGEVAGGWLAAPQVRRG